MTQSINAQTSNASSRFKVAVLGGGSFGTAIANLIAESEHEVMLWLRDQTRADEINHAHVNRRYLPDLILNTGVKASVSLEAAVTDADFVFIAVPSSSFRSVTEKLASVISDRAYVVSLTKGVEKQSFALMSQIIGEVLPKHLVGVISGPNLAKELVEKQITATVIASQSDTLISAVQQLLHTHYFRVYGNNDVFGVELGGALKNCYAIMCGMANALGSGQNTIGLLMTRSLAEMGRFAQELGANPMTFLGLAGVGDLIVTCMSPLSRNFQVGFAIGEGKPLDVICQELGQVAEGVNTLKLVKQEADKRNIYMPLIQGMYRIIYDNEPLEIVVSELMGGDHRQDVEFHL
ncbi:MAG: NAD(P)H-dependent glycerol-3-phosphate dehydrogenase [Cellvibrionales bacterium]|nr:NAD(P)H-dependent glycerol-3-phosphate dehydrogenase [Cellvibrionales bacterium]